MASAELPGTEMTAAERRRQRILAKKSARMAYAAGNRDTKPREVEEVESIAPVPKPVVSSISATPSEGVSSADQSRGLARQDTQSSLPSWLRSVVIVFAAILFVSWMRRTGDTLPVSAVELFIQLEVMFNATTLVKLAKRIWNSQRVQANGGTRSSGLSLGGILELGASVVRAVPLVRAVYQDGVLFGFVFLVSVRLSQLGYLPF